MFMIARMIYDTVDQPSVNGDQQRLYRSSVLTYLVVRNINVLRL